MFSYDIKAIERLHFDIYNKELQTVSQREAAELKDLLERSERVEGVVRAIADKYPELF